MMLIFIGGVTVNIPILDFGAQLNTVRARRDTYAAEQARLGAVGNDLASDLVKFIGKSMNERKHSQRWREKLGNSTAICVWLSLNSSRASLTPLTAIDAELALISKQEELEIDRARLLLRYAELQKAMGGTWKWIP